jgi:hypothetical protein
MNLIDYVLFGAGIVLVVGIIGFFIIGEFFIIKDDLKNKKLEKEEKHNA